MELKPFVDLSDKSPTSAIECPICMELFDTPLICSCGHTFCTKCFDLLNECPYDQTIINKEVKIKNFAIISLMDMPRAVIRERYKFSETRKNALQMYHQLVPCRHPEYKIWHKTNDKNAGNIWQGVVSYLILKVVNEDVDVFPMKISMPPELDHGWHSLLLIPQLAHHIHSVLGTIVHHRPIKASSEDSGYLARIEFGYEKYEEFFGCPCPYKNAKKKSEKFQIILKNGCGRSIAFNVNDMTTIWELKNEIELNEGIPIDQQRLIFRGKHLEKDNKTIKFYDIKKEDTLHLLLKLSGC